MKILMVLFLVLFGLINYYYYLALQQDRVTTAHNWLYSPFGYTLVSILNFLITALGAILGRVVIYILQHISHN